MPAVVQTGAPRSGAMIVSNLGAVAGVGAAAGLAFVTTPWLAVPVGGVVASLAYWQAARRQRRVKRAWAGAHRVLDDRRDREVFLTALSTALRTLRAWPVLWAYVRLDDPSPTLARSLWDLACVLARRAPVRDTRDKLAQVLVDVPTDSPVHADVTARLAQAEQAQRRFDADVERRLRDLRTLADEADRFVIQQEALADAREALTEAREVIRDADPVLDELTGAYQPVADAGAELAQRTTAVLDAYRELTIDLGH